MSELVSPQGHSGFSLRHVLQGHSDIVGAIVWSPDGQLVASASFDNTIRVWDAISGVQRKVLSGHNSRVHGVVWSPVSGYLASCGGDTTVRVWSLVSGEALRVLQGHSSWAYSVDWSPNGAALLSGAADTKGFLWDTTSWEMIGQLIPMGGDVNSAKWSPDGRTIAVATDRKFVLFNSSNISEMITLAEVSDRVNDTAWSPNGQLVASVARDGTVILWDALERTPAQSFYVNSYAQGVAFSSDARVMAITCENSIVRFWRCDTWEELSPVHYVSGNSVFKRFGFSPLVPALAVCGDKEGEINIWDLDLTVLLGLERLDLDLGEPAAPMRAFNRAVVFEPELPLRAFLQRQPARAAAPLPAAWLDRPLKEFWLKPASLGPAAVDALGPSRPRSWPGVDLALEAHQRSAAAAALHAPGKPWGRALSWWRAAAEVAPALPLGLAADLGALLAGAAPPPSAADDDAEAYPAFLRSAAATPALGAARALSLSDLAIAALLAHLAQAAPVPPEYRLPPGARSAALAATLSTTLAAAPAPADPALLAQQKALEARIIRLQGSWDQIVEVAQYGASNDLGSAAEHISQELSAAQAELAALKAQHSPPDAPSITYPDPFLAQLLERLRALSAADLRFVAELGQGALGLADLADLRALSELLSLPAFRQLLAHELLAFLPALAEAAPGSALQSYAVDGYAGLARSGSLDAVLPSEWALPPPLLAARFLNRELLYYGRERPPERRQSLLLLLVQLSDATAGDLEPLLKASALALARAGQARGALVQLASFDTRLQPLRGLSRPSELAALLRQPSRGGLDLARVLGEVGAELRARAGQYAQLELVWLLHGQAGADQVGAVGALARGLRRQAGMRALFVTAGEGLERPALAGVLAGRWASVGSAALHEAEERAKAARALRGLARPSERERLGVEPAPPVRRRVAAGGEPALGQDEAEGLLGAGRWAEALAALEPRARRGEERARLLLAGLVEGPWLGVNRPGLAWPPWAAEGQREQGEGLAPLELRLRAAELLGELGDPRLLDLRRGEAPLGGYWCPVEAGPFWYSEDEVNLRQVTLPYSYRIGRYPVTKAEYRRFVEVGGYQERRWWTEHGWAWRGRREQPAVSDTTDNAQPAHPVVNVTWYEAAAYCLWLTELGRAEGWLAREEAIRLPTSLEWVRAARGTDQRRFPWGDAEPGVEHANFREAIKSTTPVGCYPLGMAPCGALDMAGNAVEFLATPAGQRLHVEAVQDFAQTEQVLVKLGGLTGNSRQITCNAHHSSVPTQRNYAKSFRIVRSRRFGV